MNLPRISLGPCGQDALAFANRYALSEKQQLERHIHSLETALEGIEEHIKTKYEYLELMQQGKSFAKAERSVSVRTRSRTITAFDTPSYDHLPKFTSPGELRKSNKTNSDDPLSPTDSEILLEELEKRSVLDSV